jgi:hypothetical protein
MYYNHQVPKPIYELKYNFTIYDDLGATMFLFTIYSYMNLAAPTDVKTGAYTINKTHFNLPSRRKYRRRNVEYGKGERVCADPGLERLWGLFGFHDSQTSCSI